MSITDIEHLLPVDVTDEGQAIERASCRTVMMPDGRRGALWRGLAYPLVDGDRIDIAGYALPPVLCRESHTARRTFTLLNNEHGAYLLIAGPALACEAASTKLRHAGITVQRTGRYFGDPVDGLAADWFIRFERPAPQTDIAALVAPVLGTGASIPALETPDHVRLRLLGDALQEWRAREALLREQLETERARNNSHSAAEQIALLSADLASEREARAVAEARLAQVAEANFAERSAAPAKPRKIQQDVAAVFKWLLPEILLARDSLTVATIEFAERTQLYRALVELRQSSGRLPPAWKSFQGAPGWWERHISNGSADTGRIYARRAAESGSWLVLVSHKAEQARDAAWLKRN